ncbi:MAG: carcinine hydrolase/isopenicillin-N N-acyltransferase family protein, partial [Steroidobacteraceae bacterium]
YYPAADHSPNAQVSCTYISIPQVRHTYAVLLCRPFWIWGAEMGANEHGVVIGNEGLHARSPAPESEALTGMDLLRLALERASTAAEAVAVMTALLERHGQGGNCGHLTPNFYNNGFLVADRTEAFVLETIGNEWLSERVRAVRGLSNAYSIEHPDRQSAGLSTLIRDRDWSQDATPQYAIAIADPEREHIGQACARRARSTALLHSADGRLVTADMMRILRDHGPSGDSDADWDPVSATEYTLCMHAGSESRPGQTTGSLVSELNSDVPVHWVTGTAAPCISIFKPVLLNVPLPLHGPRPTDRFDSNTLWWRHERLHRTALRASLLELLNDVCEERDALEAEFRERVKEVRGGGSVADRAQIIAACWKHAHDTEDRWLARMPRIAVPEYSSYSAAWLEMNRQAGIDAFL